MTLRAPGCHSLGCRAWEFGSACLVSSLASFPVQGTAGPWSPPQGSQFPFSWVLLETSESPKRHLSRLQVPPPWIYPCHHSFPRQEAAGPPSLAGKQLHPCHLSQAEKQLLPHSPLGVPVPLSVAPPRDRIRSLSRLLARPQVPPPPHGHAGRALPAFLRLPGSAGAALRGHGGHLVPALARGLFPGRQLPDVQLAPSADGDGAGGALRCR